MRGLKKGGFVDIAGKRVLVTGAEGFIGSHLVEALLKEGCQVRALCLYNSFNSWGWIDTLSAEVRARIDVVLGDVRDPLSMQKVVAGMDIVMHLAALIAIPYSYTAPDSYVDTNIKGTLNVLNACIHENVSRILITSTSEVYGTAQYVPIDEKHPFQGQSPYSATKIGADRLAESFYRSFNAPVVIVRPFNTFGPRQSARAIIPTIITQLLKGSKNIKLGSLVPVRDFNYVADICNGFIEIAKSDKTIGEEINIATGIGINIEQLVHTIVAMINPSATITCDEQRIRPEKSEVYTLIGSNTKLTQMTQWKQHYSFEQGLRETVAWFRDNINAYKPEIYNV